MLIGMKHLHSTLAIVLLLALIVAIAIVLANYLGKKPYNRKIALLGLVSAHLQLVVGMVIYFVSPLGLKAVSAANMKNSLSRLYFLEHPVMMILGIVLITIGYSKAKKLADGQKANRTVLVCYIIGLVMFLSRIPWTTWSIF